MVSLDAVRKGDLPQLHGVKRSAVRLANERAQVFGRDDVVELARSAESTGGEVEVRHQTADLEAHLGNGLLEPEGRFRLS